MVTKVDSRALGRLTKICALTRFSLCQFQFNSDVTESALDRDLSCPRYPGACPRSLSTERKRRAHDSNRTIATTWRVDRRARVFLSSVAVTRTPGSDSGCHRPHAVQRRCQQSPWLTSWPRAAHLKTSSTPMDQEKQTKKEVAAMVEYEGLVELLLSSRQPDHLPTCALDRWREMAPRIIVLRHFDCSAAEKDARTATRSLRPRERTF